jgi:hypothetical protein
MGMLLAACPRRYYNKIRFFQMRTNSMDIYAAEPDEGFLDMDSRNLFALRWDIHTFQFESGNLVIVPIDGRMVVHFIGRSRESAALYHNKPFDSSNLSHEFLFARFAWAIIKKARTIFMSHPAAGRKAINLITSNAARLDEEQVMGPDDGGGGEPVDSQRKPGVTGKQKTTRKRKRPDNPGFKDPATREAHELDEDIAKAKRVAPFFRMSLKPDFTVLVSNVFVLIVEPEGVANPYAYQNMMWYPGSGIVEKKKLEYMDAHPNIRAYSEQCASSDTDSISEGTMD